MMNAFKIQYSSPNLTPAHYVSVKPTSAAAAGGNEKDLRLPSTSAV